MILKPRPISEAPRSQWLLTRTIEGQNVEFAARWYRHEDQTSDVNGTEIWTTADLLRAAEILAAITPEGYELTGEVRAAGAGEFYSAGGDHAYRAAAPTTSKVSILRKLPPPVRYRFEAEEKPRVPVVGDWIWTGDVWELVTAPCALGIPQLCARRVEVKP